MNNKYFFRFFVIILTTVILLGGSVLMLLYVSRSLEVRRSTELIKTLDSIAVSLLEKVRGGVDILYDLRGLARLEERYPGGWNDNFQALLSDGHHKEYSVAFAEKVAKEDLPEFEVRMRKMGSPEYKRYIIFPKTKGEVSYPIANLYTTDPDIQTLLGFDLQYSEKTAAIFAQSIRDNKPTMSALANLNIIIPSSKKTGYEVIVPLYKKDLPENITEEERINNLAGFLGVWINTEVLKDPVVGITGLRYTLYDGEDKVFSTGTLEKETANAAVSKEMEILNRKMKIVLESDRTYRLPIFEENLPRIALLAAIIINLFWILSVYTFLSARRQAVELAELATRDLKKFKQAVDGVSDQVVIADKDGVIIYANEATEKITGYSRSEMIGKRPSLWGGQMSKEYYQNFWKTIKDDKKPFRGEMNNRRKNGEIYESEVNISPILDDDGELKFFVAIERDMGKIRAVDRIKTEFISLASHQLRTPLSAVKWFGEILAEGNAGKLSKKQAEYVRKIINANEREIQLVNALLNVSRIESGKISVLPKATDLKEILETSVADFKVDKTWRKKKLEVKIEKNLPKLQIDPNMIRHVYANLLVNASRYTAADGKIEVRIYIKGNEVISEVKDNGIGIPASEQERIFEKFFRASNAMKKDTDGSGLGLYLSKTIIESSGGKIWFTSEVGKGTTFFFSLPIESKKKKPPRRGGGLR